MTTLRMARLRTAAVSVVICCLLGRLAHAADILRGQLQAAAGHSVGAAPATSSSDDLASGRHGITFPEALRPASGRPAIDQMSYAPHGGGNGSDESAKFPRAYQVPDTDIWWKLGGYVKGDFIHDFEPAGTLDRFVPITIPTDGFGEDNTLLQAKASRLNLDVRTPTDWGVVRGFVEGDFFTSDNSLRLRHAYTEVNRLLVGQTWTAFTDPDSIPRTLDFESPIAFIVLRQSQIRWTQPLSDSLNWVISIENPTTSIDDEATATIPGLTEQPLPDLVTRLKYENDWGEWMIAGLLRELAYQPDAGPAFERFGVAVNTVGVLYPTDSDKIIAQFVIGNGLGRYRSGSDLGLETPTTLDLVTHMGGCLSLMHEWTETLSSTGAYSFAFRREMPFDPPTIPRFANYLAVNLIWEPIDNTSFGVEYLYGTNETQDGDSGYANRLQATVQYNLP